MLTERERERGAKRKCLYNSVIISYNGEFNLLHAVQRETAYSYHGLKERKKLSTREKDSESEREREREREKERAETEEGRDMWREREKKRQWKTLRKINRNYPERKNQRSR